jgi:UDP-glucose 4-epimerase
MKEFNVYKLIFSSSATVYDSSQPLPWRENYKTGTTSSPYGASKFIIEQILIDLVKYDKKWSIRIARYFNPIGNHSSGLIKENPKGTPNNLLPYLIKVAKKNYHI